MSRHFVSPAYKLKLHTYFITKNNIAWEVVEGVVINFIKGGGMGDHLLYKRMSNPTPSTSSTTIIGSILALYFLQLHSDAEMLADLPESEANC